MVCRAARYVAAVAGRVTADGKIDGDSLVDLRPSSATAGSSGTLRPASGEIMKFTHVQAPPLEQNKQVSVDGASKDCVDWYIQTVYQPHFDHFGADFGKTIVGFFYDEPETAGDWGTELGAVSGRMEGRLEEGLCGPQVRAGRRGAGGGEVSVSRGPCRGMGPHHVWRHHPLVPRAPRDVDRSLHGTQQPLPLRPSIARAT